MTWIPAPPIVSFYLVGKGVGEMGHERFRLTAAKVKREKAPGMYADGGGLYLQVRGATSRCWILRYTLDGRARYLGLGSADVISLADARARADDARRLLVDKIDPIEHRAAARQAARRARAAVVTFREAATRYIAAHAPGWRNATHAKQWPATLEAHVYPILGPLPVQAIDTGLVVKVLEPIWLTIPETAGRVRGRVESVLDWAAARGYRQGDNPARWRGHLDHLLPSRASVRGVKHHAALPFLEIGAFFAALGARAGVAPRALAFTILTAARTSEALGASWAEIDLDAAVWTVPPERIKTKREHRVPLSPPALVLLRQIKAEQERAGASAYVFPGDRPGQPLSNMALLGLLRRMGRSDVTTHGFRSTFRDWAAERTNFPREVAEMALAHAIGSKVEAAYRRGDLFKKRRQLMDAWGKYCGTVAPAGELVPMQPTARGGPA